jgi:uncharacterized membrane protein YfcA
MSALDILSLTLAAIVGSAAQSATGFGVALPVAPIAFALVSPADAVITVAAASLMHNILVLATRHRRLTIRTGDAALLIGAALPGVILGALIVSHAPKAPMQLSVGLAILLAVLFRLHEPGRLTALASPAAGAATGIVAGALTTTVGINGPPLVVWLRARRATLAQLRDTLAIIFLTLNLAAIPSVAAQGGTIPSMLLPALAAGLLIGHILGLQAHQRIPTRALDQALVAILTAGGGAGILAAVTTWF